MKEKIKVFLDDERPTPDGWIGCRWPDEVIHLLNKYEVTDLSLDHDLGEIGNNARTGYDVILYIEEETFLKYSGEGKRCEMEYPPKIIVHSANSGARPKMEQGIATIEKLHSDNLKWIANFKG